MAERRGFRITTWNGKPKFQFAFTRLVLIASSERDQVSSSLLLSLARVRAQLSTEIHLVISHGVKTGRLR